jgi:peptidoglycan hydrolase-like protein with peptidoglycan-binding domain
MSNSEDFDAIQTFFNTQTPKTAIGADTKTAFLQWSASQDRGWITGFGTSDSQVQKAKDYRDQYNKAEFAPLPVGQQLSAEEKKYFQDMPVVNTTGMSAEDAQKAIWTKQANSPPPPAGSVWLGGKPAVAPAVKHATIKQGSKGADVVAWQKIVNINPDGNFGPQTTAITKKWQKDHNLKDDGIVGAATWTMAEKTTNVEGAPMPPAPQQVAAVSGQNTVTAGTPVAAAHVAAAKTGAATVSKPAVTPAFKDTKVDTTMQSGATAFQTAVNKIESGAKVAEAGMLSVPKKLPVWAWAGLIGSAVAGLAYAIWGKPKTRLYRD